jgi:hypothetical protein
MFLKYKKIIEEAKLFDNSRKKISTSYISENYIQADRDEQNGNNILEQTINKIKAGFRI